MTESTTKLNKDIIEWSCHSLLSHGYTLKSDIPETIQDTPWSYVARFLTSTDYVYLKHTPSLLALEADIIRILKNQFHASVPKIIAHNAELNCFLMQDAGKSLRGILKHKFDEELLFKAINQFTLLQLAVADHVDVLLDIGVPDWRLNKLSSLYEQLLSQKEVLLEDGLSETEIIELEKLLPTVSSLCKTLSSYSIKQTLVQPDFNDNNTLIDETMQNITIIDLGEIAISHPFFSLINCLYVIKKHHGLTEQDERYLKIKDACFKNYLNFESKKNLLDAFEIASILFFIYGALGSHRLMVACEKSKFTPSFQRHGRPSVSLKEFIIACNKNK